MDGSEEDENDRPPCQRVRTEAVTMSMAKEGPEEGVHPLHAEQEGMRGGRKGCERVPEEGTRKEDGRSGGVGGSVGTYHVARASAVV